MDTHKTYSPPEVYYIEYSAEGAFSTSSWDNLEDPGIVPPVNWD
jgi:hypothetical protein